MLKFNELQSFLAQEAAIYKISILKFSKWINNDKINLDIMIENEENNATTISDCVKINKLALKWLKNENLNTKTNLSIRGPAIDRELLSLKDLKKFKKEKIKISLHNPINNQRNFEGFIKSIECDLITFKDEREEFEFQWQDIKKTKIVPDWNQIMKKTKVEKL